MRLQRNNAETTATTVAQVEFELENTINKLTDFGDAGRTLPDVHLLVGARIINLSGLADAAQAIALAKTELENMPPDEKIVIVASLKD